MDRITYFDQIKGFAILLVVIGHVFGYCLTPASEQLSQILIFRMLSAFHMPLFMFVSGYFAYKTLSVQLMKTQVVNKAITLLLPFLTVGGLFAASINNFHGLFLGDMKIGYWFTFTLFEIFLIFYPLTFLFQKINKKSVFIIDVLLYGIPVIALELIYYFDIFPEAIQQFTSFYLIRLHFKFFVFGAMCRKYVKLDNLLKRNNLMYSVMLIIFVSLMILRKTYYNHLMLILLGFSGICCAYYFFANYGEKINPIISRYLTYWGQHSLDIYLLHYFFLGGGVKFYSV